jgi:stress-induced morphogen
VKFALRRYALLTMQMEGLPMHNDPTPAELSERIESVLAGSKVTEASGDGHHFRVRIVSPTFEGLSLIERHRTVNEVFAGELGGRIHALSMSCVTPEEDQ